MTTEDQNSEKKLTKTTKTGTYPAKIDETTGNTVIDTPQHEAWRLSMREYERVWRDKKADDNQQYYDYSRQLSVMLNDAELLLQQRWSTRDVADYFRVRHTGTVINWIKKGWLKADRTLSLSPHSGDRTGRYWISYDEIMRIESLIKAVPTVLRPYTIRAVAKMLETKGEALGETEEEGVTYNDTDTAFGMEGARQTGQEG
jgi:hypothetical protein